MPVAARPLAPGTLATGALDPAGLALVAACGALGYLLARRVRLPAATFIGPLLGSMAVHLTGLVATQPPYLLLALAQLVIGSSVGARFSGTPLRLVARALALGVGATLLMLIVTLAFGAVLHGVTGHPLGLLVLAFIPGGFAEMSLIALGMGVDPAFVVTHHSVRVFLVVLIALPAFAWLRRSGWLGAAPAERAELDSPEPCPHHRGRAAASSATATRTAQARPRSAARREAAHDDPDDAERDFRREAEALPRPAQGLGSGLRWRLRARIGVAGPPPGRCSSAR